MRSLVLTASLIRIWPTLVPTGTLAPTQNSYGAPTKSGSQVSGPETRMDPERSINRKEYDIPSFFLFFFPFNFEIVPP